MSFLFPTHVGGALMVPIIMRLPPHKVHVESAVFFVHVPSSVNSVGVLPARTLIAPLPAHSGNRFSNNRRDLLYHVIVLNERHLKRLMSEYVRYYHDDRTHLALEKGTPAGRRAAESGDAACRVVSMPRLGGLHHRYDRAA
ncbi:MAG: hypothetical protein ABR924_23780 [Terracidiphilus sp.]